MRVLFSHVSYYLIFFLFVLWIIALIQRIGTATLRSKVAVPGIIFCLLLSGAVFVSVKPAFRVLSDETNLLAISKSMTYERRTDNVTMGNYYFDNFYPIRREMPKRPLVFPFLTHIAHAFLGYRPANVFIVNFLALFALLFLIFTLVRERLGNIWAASSALLVASQPVVAECAASGGFDLTAALFMVISFACLGSFLKAPGAVRFRLLWLSLLMLGNVRYENIMCFPIVLAFLFAFKYVKTAYFKGRMSFVYFLTPILLLPVFWQRMLIKNSYDTGDAPFAFSYFVQNHITFIKSLFDFRFFLPYATIVNLIGAAGLVYFLIKAKKQFSHLWFISGACLAGHWLVYTSYHLGRVDHPSSARLFVLFYILLSVSALFFLSASKVLRKKPVYVIIFSLAIFALYNPVAAQGRFSRTQTLPRKYRFTMNFLKKEADEKRSFLVITERPGQYTVWNYAAVNFAFARKNRSLKEHIKRHLYENVFVIQDIRYESGLPTEKTHLGSGFSLKTAAESQNDAEHFTRISKVGL